MSDTKAESFHPGVRLLIPVDTSGRAIAAGYAALFALLVVPAPVALFLGISAIRDIRRNPHKHGMGRAIFAICMGSVFTLLLMLLIAMAVTEFWPAE